MGSHYVLHYSVWWLLNYKIVRNVRIYLKCENFKIWYSRVAASWGSFYDCLAYKYAYVSRRVKACQFTFTHFHFLLPLVYLYVLVAVIRTAVVTCYTYSSGERELTSEKNWVLFDIFVTTHISNRNNTVYTNTSPYSTVAELPTR
jgi:hypothetical protein